jgi:restriction system protein
MRPAWIVQRLNRSGSSSLQCLPPLWAGCSAAAGGINGRKPSHVLLIRLPACTQHAAGEAARRREVTERKRAYDRQAAAAADAAAAHNAEVDQFERDYQSGEPEAVAQFCTLALDSSVYPEGFVHRTRVLYRPDPREVVVEFELPPQSVIPLERDYKYVAARDEIDTVGRPVKDIKVRYARLIAQVALRAIHEVFACDRAKVASAVTFNGHVSTKDLATGQPVRPCLISVSAEREIFGTFVLADLDPVTCLRKLNALVSDHPYDFEAVRPVVDFETLLTQYKFVDGMDAVAGLDETAVFGGLCIVQAKRYKGAVGVEAVRALAGVMEDKHATKGIMVTTSWVTKDGHGFAERHGRIEIMECEQIKFLCQEHLGLDVLISPPKAPPQRR